MQQIPEGKDGSLTNEQRRRALHYAFDLSAGFIDDSAENRKIAEQMRKGFTSEPKTDK